MDIEVRVQPRAKRNHIEVLEDKRLKIYVTAAPESGKANDAVIALLSKALRTAKGNISVVRGHKSRNKLIRVESGEVYDRLSSK